MTEYQELKTKTEDELQRLMREARSSLQAIEFRVRRGEEKDVRRIRELKCDVARMETILSTL